MRNEEFLRKFFGVLVTLGDKGGIKNLKIEVTSFIEFEGGLYQQK